MTPEEWQHARPGIIFWEVCPEWEIHVSTTLSSAMTLEKFESMLEFFREMLEDVEDGPEDQGVSFELPFLHQGMMTKGQLRYMVAAMTETREQYVAQYPNLREEHVDE